MAEHPTTPTSDQAEPAESLPRAMSPAGERPNHQAGVLEQLKTQLETTPLPPLRQTAERVIALTQSDWDIRDISATILRDQAMTVLVLRVANSAAYGRYGPPVTSVTRAILVLGASTLRALAMKAACAELATAPEEVKQVAWRTLLAASYAEALGGAIGLANPERVVLHAVLSTLAELALAWYQPERYAALARALAELQADREQACQRALGVAFDELKAVVMQTCGVPAELLGSVRPGCAEEAIVRLALLVADQQAQQPTGPLSEEQVQTGLAATRWPWGTSVSTIHEALLRGLETATLCAHALGLTAAKSAEGREPARVQPEPRVRPVAPTVLLGCLQELARYLGEPQQHVNTILSYILEGLYRGAGFDQVGLALRVGQSPQFAGRVSLGEPPIHGLLQGSFEEDGIIQDCVRSERPLRHADPGILRTRLPQGLWRASQPAWVAVGPLLVGSRPIGAIIACVRQPWPEQDELRWQSFGCLLAQAQTALSLAAERRGG